MSEVDARYTRGRLELLRGRVQVAVAGRRGVDGGADDRFRGLYITDDEAGRVLDERAPLAASDDALDAERLTLEAWADEREADGERIRLRSVAHEHGLDLLDVEMLLIAIGPDLDPRFERAYGYLHDDVTRRRASIGLTLELCGRDPLDIDARARLGPSGPLVVSQLLQIEDTDRPYLTRALRVPDPVTAHLLGARRIDTALDDFRLDAVTSDRYDTAIFERSRHAGQRLFYVRDRIGAAALSFAASGATAAGLGVLALDLDRLAPDAAVDELAAAAGRQARLASSALVVGPVEQLADRGAGAVRAFAECGAVVVMIGTATWDPLWSRVPPLVLEAPAIGEVFADRLPFRLTPEQSARAHLAAGQQATAEGTEPSLEHLAAGARAQNAGGLERLALRVSPRCDWTDLVLPDPVLQQLHELVSRVRYRDYVLNGWGLRRSAAKGQGVTGLFAGDSGTGKTLAAEVVAGELGLDLYVIDLATVVDKYIGETEKNLDRIFREADRVNGVLLFDEADAIFGKRSDVQDAHDRHANVEVAYLLQRMERFDGVALLTTNLRANIDEAFLRRLDALVDFPLPADDMRRQLWERHLPDALPRAEDVDLAFLASRFDLSGGNIRNIAVSAAFLAAAAGEPLTMGALIRATAREYRKLGRMCVDAEFAPYHPHLTATGDPHVHH